MLTTNTNFNNIEYVEGDTPLLINTKFGVIFIRIDRDRESREVALFVEVDGGLHRIISDDDSPTTVIVREHPADKYTDA